ncbi:hypothetical protein [Cerasicoccus maritimus]|uniref:hypothetical protein n=1 Tax=Cerasicoccus maritimus TaxID=490089 RepID=UPI00285281B1|nr:hypothetical protein [Cerasicoccus maritimus]
MSKELEPHRPEPEDLGPRELDALEFPTPGNPSYHLDGVPHYNTFPAFNVDEPKLTLHPDIEAYSDSCEIPDQFFHDKRFDPLGKSIAPLTDQEAKLRKRMFCETAPELIRIVIHTLADLSLDNSPDIRARALDQMQVAAESIGSDLASSKEYVSVLHGLAATLTRHLENSADKHEEETKGIARRQLLWPVLMGPRGNQKEKASEWVRSLELAKDYIENPTKQGVDRSLEANAYAHHLIEYLDRLRRIKLTASPGSFMPPARVIPIPLELYAEIHALAPLSSANADDWFNSAWNILMFFTEQHPERYAALEHLGEYQVKEDRSTTLNKRSIDAEDRSRMMGIRKVLKQSFRRIAKERE